MVQTRYKIANLLIIATLLNSLLPLRYVAAAPPAKSYVDEILVNKSDRFIPMAAASTLFFDTFNPASPDWVYIAKSGLHPLGHDDNQSLYVAEQVGVCCGGTGQAAITLTMPALYNTVHLRFWSQTTGQVAFPPGGPGGGSTAPVRVWVNGTLHTATNSRDAWSLFEFDITNDVAGASQINLTFEVTNRPGGEFRNLFDEITVYYTGGGQPLPPDQTLARNECPFCGNGERQNYIGGPINTQSGNYGYQAVDFNIPTAGPPLRFERSYNSYTVLTNTIVYSRPLGYGWTHNYDLDLTFGAGEVQLKAPHGSRMRFTDNGNGTYNPSPGVWAEMVSSGSGATAVYTVTAANQETFVFNHLGRWIRHLDPKGNEMTLTRTNGVTLTRVTGPAGQRWLDFSYDAQGRLSTVTDHTGRQVSYSYDANDNLITVNDTRGNDWSYTYDANHLLQEVRDSENTTIERTLYDGQGRAIRQEDGTGNALIEITYLSNGERLITDHGRQTTDVYDPATNLLIKQTDALNRERNYSLDANFNRTGATGPRGNATGYAKTAFGLTTAITDALGNVTTFSYDSRNNLTQIQTPKSQIQNQYDSQNNLTQINTPTGPINYSYNAAGQVTSVTNRRGHTWNYQYDAAGNLTQIVNPKSEIVNLQYDTLGRLTALTNARNMTTRFEYDAAGNLIRVTLNEQSGSCDPTECNLVTEYRYDKANRLTAVIDPQGRETRREYDVAGRLSRVIRNYQDGVFSNAAPDEDIITRYQYDQYGRLQSIFQTLNQSEERETRYEYDALNRISRVTVNYAPGSSNPDQNLVTTYAYEDSGSKLLVTVTNPAGIATRTEYDELGRPSKIINNYKTGTCPATECNLTTTYNYDSVSNLTSLVDPLNIRTKYEYDTFNRLTAVIENYTGSGAYGGIPDENVKTQFTYDPEGNLTQISDPISQIATLQYDELNRVIQQANALGHTWSYDYDPAGNLTQITDPQSQVTNLQHNLVNRLTTIDYPAPDADVTFTYDKTGNRTQMSDGTGTTTYSYDNLNRPTQIVNPKSEIVIYQYDARGNRTHLTYPDTQGGTSGKTITYAYDRLDRLIDLTPSWDSGSYQYAYNSQLQLESLIRPNGLQTAYGYDSASRLTGLTHQSSGWTMEYGYTLNEIGNITRAEETFTSFQSIYLPIVLKNASPLLLTTAAALTPTTRIIDYQYDDLSRLTAADYSTGEFFHYSYDPRGNRLTQSTISGTTNYSYDNANRLIQVGSQSYTWDDNGNLLNDGQRTYSYDSANRLISVTEGITTTQFTYNGDGDRISQTTGGVTTDYALDPVGLAQVLVATTGGQSEFYVPGLAQYTNSSWQYFAPDRLGSIRQIVDSTGQLLLAQSFDPFGNVLEQGGAGQSIFGYTGEQTDSTDLIYLRARYYSPGAGRFLSPDTIVPEPLRSVGWNRYAYVENNAIRYTDPSGYLFEDPNKCLPFCNSSPPPPPPPFPPLPPPSPADFRVYLPGWENREDISQAMSAFVVVTDVGETLVSLGGIGVEVTCMTTICAAVDAIDPYGPPVIETVLLGIAAYQKSGLDQIEYSLSFIGLLSTIGADIYGENSCIDSTTGDIVIGQDTAIGLSTFMANFSIGEAFIDFGLNAAELSYDYNRFRGNIPDIFEVRINFTKSGYLDVHLIDDEER